MKKLILTSILLLYFNLLSAQEKSPEVQKIHDAGYVKMEKKDYPGAIKEFEKLLKIAPKDPITYYTLSQSNYWNKNYKKSVEYATEGLKYDKNETLLYFFRAKANIELKNFDTVCQDLKDSIGLGDDLMEIYCKK